MKEKSRWFSSLRDLTRKLKVKFKFMGSMHLIEFNNEKHALIIIFNFLQQLLKMEQIKLAEEALSYKKSVGDMNEVNSIIMSKCKYLPI